MKQEQALAKDRVLLGVFYLAYNGWQIDDIVAKYEFTRSQVFSLLRKLDGIGVLDLLPGDQVRMKVARNLRLRQARADRAGLWSCGGGRIPATGIRSGRWHVPF